MTQLILIFLVHRLRISFKWMVRAFSGYLATDQLLLLWDRILGYNSLEILAGKSKCLFVKLMLFLHEAPFLSDTYLQSLKKGLHSSLNV